MDNIMGRDRRKILTHPGILLNCLIKDLFALLAEKCSVVFIQSIERSFLCLIGRDNNVAVDSNFGSKPFYLEMVRNDIYNEDVLNSRPGSPRRYPESSDVPQTPTLVVRGPVKGCQK